MESSKSDNLEQTEVAPVAVAEASTVEEIAPVSVETGAESTKENETVVEEKVAVAVVDAPAEEASVKEEVAGPVEETPVAKTEQETTQNVEVATDSGEALTEQEQVSILPETSGDEVITDVSALEEVAQPIVNAEPIQENEKQVEVTAEESQVVQTSEE